jgi:hypothetical protein
VLISLVREHTEQMNPPRALWVPFDLGRPMGAPDEPDFQRRVLESGLSLLAEKSGPVLADFPDDAPGSKPEDMSGWVCPVNLAPADADEAESCLRAQLEQEMTALQPWYDLQLEQKGRTTVGVGADNIRDSAKLIAGFLEDPSIDSPCDYRPLALMLKYNAEDLKAWYFEAATAQPGGSGRELADWFWKATTAGKSLLQLASTMRACDNKGLQALGTKGIVPRAYEHLVP